MVEILATWKKNFKVPRSTPKYLEVHQSKLAEKDIKTEDVTLANDDHQVPSILQQSIEPKQSLLCNVDLDMLCSVDLSSQIYME